MLEADTGPARRNPTAGHASRGDFDDRRQTASAPATAAPADLRAATRPANGSERTGPARSAVLPTRPPLPGQVVLVLQGGGALGAYQVGVYQALHEAGIEPDWVIGTSIGAINAALIAGNAPAAPARRGSTPSGTASSSAGRCRTRSTGSGLANALGQRSTTVTRGIPGLLHAATRWHWRGSHAPLGVEAAAYYSTAPLRDDARAS